MKTPASRPAFSVHNFRGNYLTQARAEFEYSCWYA